MKNLGANAIYFSPVFESDTHGYNTRDYSKIDTRLGTNEDFQSVCKNLHKAGIKVVLDGVFNHVGRGFWAFQDVLENDGIPHTKTGFISVLTVIQTTMTVSGMKAGKAIMIL